MDDLRHLIPAPLLAEASRLRRLTASLYRMIPSELAPHCEIIGLDDGILTIGVESPAWQTRLRFLQNDLLRTWQSQDPSISGIRIQVLVAPAEPEPAGRRANPMPEQAAEGLQQAARHIGHKGLAAALRRLAARARREN